MLIVGYPSETELDFEETKKLLRRYAHLAYSKKIQIGITPTFALLNNSPLATNPALAQEYGLEHNHLDQNKERFWTSTRYLDNDYPTRSRRWKELTTLSEELGYTFQSGMPIDKWRREISSLDKIYNDSKTKVFSIRTGQ